MSDEKALPARPEPPAEPPKDLGPIPKVKTPGGDAINLPSPVGSPDDVQDDF